MARSPILHADSRKDTGHHYGRDARIRFAFANRRMTMIRNGRSDVRARSTRLVAALLGALFALSNAAAWATDVRLVNFASYSYMNNSADLQTDGVRNFDSSPSGPLRLELWAFSSPYASGMSGVPLASYPLSSLNPGEATGAIDSGTVMFATPPAGVWYFSMLLTEFIGGSPGRKTSSPGDDGYVARYWINFLAPEYIGVPQPPNRVEAVEFYHAVLDHYFVAVTAKEISDLDMGLHPGWWRTGYSFFVWDAAGGRSGPVCRYYIPPGYGDSHFYSASSYECGIAPAMFPWILKESDTVFNIALPDPGTGACASNEVPVYRLWNGRTDSGHRYTTSTAVKAMMIAQGFTAEGYGPDQVAMCAPQ
jgi:hypothetical protein